LPVLTNISKYVHTFTLSIQTTPTNDINLKDMNVNCERLMHHIIRCNHYAKDVHISYSNRPKTWSL